MREKCPWCPAAYDTRTGAIVGRFECAATGPGLPCPARDIREQNAMTTDREPVVIPEGYTPGPWEWAAGDVGIECSERYCDVFKDGGEHIIANINDLFDRHEGQANAALIALAPRMAEEIVRLRAEIERLTLERDGFNIISSQSCADDARARGGC